MFGSVSASFRWLRSLGGKFFRVAPGPTLLVIPATLVSQISELLVFLLPLKVLILFGSDGLPHYFPQALMQFDRDTLLIFLGIATPVFYLLHLAMEGLISKGADQGARRLLAQSRKIVLFENQDDIATASYRRYAGALANAVFIICVWLALGIAYPPLCFLLVGYTVVCMASVGFAYRVSKGLREHIEESLASFLRVLSALGFLLVFFFWVLQFISGAAPNFLVVIVSLILARQTFNRKVGLVSAIVNLYENRLKLNALFFSGQALSRVDYRQEEFWSLFAPQTREIWLRQLLAEQLTIEPKWLKINWHQTGVRDLATLEIEAQDSNNELVGRYLLRVYGKNPSLLATHEATLLFDESSEHLPALPLLAVGQVGKWHYHILSLTEGCTCVTPAGYTERYFTALWVFEPSEDLADRYTRSHPMLWQRLDASLIERLSMVASDDDLPLVRDLEAHLPGMLATLQSLPLAVVNPDINGNTLMKNAEGELRINYWGRWTLEPLGSGWPFDQKKMNLLVEVLQRASKQRMALQSVDVQAVSLAALLFKFDKLCAHQFYLDALALIPQLLALGVADSDQADEPKRQTNP